MFKAMCAPYGGLMFMPTGGLNENNILSYLKFNKILARGGSVMVPTDLLDAGKFDEIKRLTRDAVMLMHARLSTSRTTSAALLSILFRKNNFRSEV